jgi:hypothetical protein
MVNCNVNRAGQIAYDKSAGYFVTNRMTYGMDTDYFKEQSSKYRVNNLDYISYRQKRWYDRQTDTILRKFIKQSNPSIRPNRSYNVGDKRIQNKLKSKRRNQQIRDTDKKKQKLILELESMFGIRRNKIKPPFTKHIKTTTISFS